MKTESCKGLTGAEVVKLGSLFLLACVIVLVTVHSMNNGKGDRYVAPLEDIRLTMMTTNGVTEIGWVPMISRSYDPLCGVTHVVISMGATNDSRFYQTARVSSQRSGSVVVTPFWRENHEKGYIEVYAYTRAFQGRSEFFIMQDGLVYRDDQK